MLNYQVFQNDPLETPLPNNGVSKLEIPTQDKEWDVLRYELKSFVCEGEYQRGFERILSTYLSHVEAGTQPAVWVSGFFGSGKSHLVKMLDYLWQDSPLPGGALPSSLVHLPQSVVELLRELSTKGKQSGGRWAAAGTLGASAAGSIRLAILGIVFAAAGLPTRYPHAKFRLWLRSERLEAEVIAVLQAQDRSLEREVSNLYVSKALAEALLTVRPGLADTPAKLLELLKAQFPNVQDVSNEDFVDTFTEVVQAASGSGGRTPCTLLVLDELQQFINDNPERMHQVQEAIQACSSRFGGKLLVVATGQAALTASPLLQKIQGRFTVQVTLSQSDVTTVLRKVVLSKASDKLPEVQATLERVSGEIDRQLQGSQIGPRSDDRPFLAADYPLLPSRWRFWEEVMRAVDVSGTSQQVRNSLRTVQNALTATAHLPLGHVIPADFIFGELRQGLVQSGQLLGEVDALISGERTAGDPESAQRSSLLALVFLISRLDPSRRRDLGLHATPATLADLLISDLHSGDGGLRTRIPALLEGLVSSGKLVMVDGEYRMQTGEGREWNAQYQAALGHIGGDESRIVPEREARLKTAVGALVKDLKLVQGVSKTPRSLEAHFTPEPPPVSGSKGAVWVVNGWNDTEEKVRAAMSQAGPDSPLVALFLPRYRADALKGALAGQMATAEVLMRAQPSTAEGQEARAAMDSRKQGFEIDLKLWSAEALRGAKVFMGGGTEVTEGSDLSSTLRSAAESALVRLFPQFMDADALGWDKVFEKASKGQLEALSSVGYSGEADRHPVCRALLKDVQTGRRGKDLLERFGGSPFGWESDAVNGALATLVAGGHVRVTQNGQPRTVSDLERRQMREFEFRAEKTVISVPQKIALKRLMIEAGVSVKVDDLSGPALTLLERLDSQVKAAGGEAPAPERPSNSGLLELQNLSGNDLLARLFELRETLSEQWKAWGQIAGSLQERLPRWGQLEALLKAGGTLSALEPIHTQRDAIRATRTLLSDPDPVPPLLTRATDALREALSHLQTQLEHLYQEQRQRLEGDSSWLALTPQDRAELERRLPQIPESPDLSSAESLLRELARETLPSRHTRMDALSMQFERVLNEARVLLEPKVVNYRPRGASLKTAQDVRQYVEALERDLLERIEAGTPVMVG